MSETWRIVYVEDEDEYRKQVKEFLEGAEFDHGALEVTAVEKFADAQALLASRKVDLVVLDVFDAPIADHKAAGLDVLAQWKATGFAPVVLYTALPENVTGEVGPFVELVGKDKGLEALMEAIGRLFKSRVPQTHRAIADHIEGAVRSYMWEFVAANWEQFKELTSHPEFLRLLLARLAAELGRNLQPVLERLYEGEHRDPSPEKVHPAAYYVKPPIGSDALLGDLRMVDGAIVFVLWPSCDMVMRDGKCKVDSILCARTTKLADTTEYAALKTARDEKSAPKTKKAMENLERLCHNQRDGKGVQSERYHFLPQVWDIPAVVIDFADLAHLSMAKVRESTCIATVASPYAEAISARFLRYIARIGTPDLDLEIVFKSL